MTLLRLMEDDGSAALLEVDLQARQSELARGRIRLEWEGNEIEIDDNIGFVQTAAGWTSFTATATSDGAAEAVLVIIDDQNPLEAGTTVTVRQGDSTWTLRPVPVGTLLGAPLRLPAWSAAVRGKLEEDLAIARAQFDVAPHREDSFIWLGRRLGYLARWDEAIELFTRGIELFPQSYKLYRFRGRHRARRRELEAAIEDYRRAAELVENEQDSFEPDGIINPRHQYLGTYKSNIHYYLGQTSYAVGDYEATLRGMERAAREPLGQSPDRLVSTAYWRYLAHRKLGQHDEARAVVADIPTELDIVENFTYYDAVLYFKGSRTAEEILPGADSIVRFAVAMELHFRGEQTQAETMWRTIVDDSAQGFWPAEAEILFSRQAGR